MPDRIRIFIDIDGTLAKWTPVAAFEELLRPGFYRGMAPNLQVVTAANLLANGHSDEVEVFTLSAYIKEHGMAVAEKDAWLDAYVPVIDKAHRIYCHCGEDKSLYVPDGIDATDILLDDYSTNLHAWRKKGRALKLLNGVNATKGTWTGALVSMFQPADTLAAEILAFARNQSREGVA